MPHFDHDALSPDLNLFADIDETGVPEPILGEPSEAYLDTLKRTYDDSWQIKIVNGMWELAGLAGDSSSTVTLDDPVRVSLIYDALDDMREGFSVFNAVRCSRAGSMLLEFANKEPVAEPEGESDKKALAIILPTSLLLADLNLIPSTPPKPFTEGHTVFTQHVEDLLGLNGSLADDEILNIMDKVVGGVFRYRPSNLLGIYWTVASALPDANIPDSLGRMIYDVQHGTFRTGFGRRKLPTQSFPQI